MKIVLIRHPTTALAPGLCYGRLDPGLREDAAAAGLRALVAAWPGRVWTSPARRCRAIAGAAAVIDARLAELDFGAWEGRPWADVPRADLDRWAADPLRFAPPGGESGAALLARVQDFCVMLCDRAEDAVVVAHGGSLKLLAPMLRGTVPDLLAAAPPLGSVSEIRC